jgi:hypothetical protein
VLDGDDAFGRRLEALDLSLFKSIHTESSDGDRKSWLAVQRSVRRPAGYTYLEIGSHLGGSIQQHLIDPLCRRIISIDKRPLALPDDRGRIIEYEGNSTARMMDNLRRVGPDDLGKIACFDSDARDVPAAEIPEPPDFCFIDGVHVHDAVLSDFKFCLSVCAPDAAICFHDDWVVHRALGEILSSLRHSGVPFTARKLDDLTFGIFLRGCAAANDPFIRSTSVDGTRWLRVRRIRGLLPGWLRPVARSFYRRAAGVRTQTTA